MGIHNPPPAGSGSGDMLAANNLSDLANPSTARTNLGVNTTANQSSSTDKNFVTDAELLEIADISGKQDALVSATNIKTVNGASILGSGDLVVSGGLAQFQIRQLTRR